MIKTSNTELILKSTLNNYKSSKDKANKNLIKIEHEHKKKLCNIAKSTTFLELTPIQQEVIKKKYKYDKIKHGFENPEEIKNIEDIMFQIKNNDYMTIHIKEKIKPNIFSIDLNDDDRRERLIINKKNVREEFDRVADNIDFSYPSTEFIDALCKDLGDTSDLQNKMLIEEIKGNERMKKIFLNRINKNIQFIDNNTLEKIKIPTLELNE